VKKALILAFAIFVATVFSGCAGKSDYMQPAVLSQADTALTQDEAAIVFFRPSTFGFLIQAPIAEFADGELKLVSIVSAKSKVFYKTTIGKHFFIVGGEGNELLEADIEGGKTYYSYIQPQLGLVKARFAFKPVTDIALKSQDFLDDLNACTWHTNKPEAQAWFFENKESMLNKYQSALTKHQEAEPKDKKIILPEYGL
jgi:hypothetical protein